MGSTTSGEYWGNRLPQLINYGKDGRLNLRSVKLYADGPSFFEKFKAMSSNSDFGQARSGLGGLLCSNPILTTLRPRDSCSPAQRNSRNSYGSSGRMGGKRCTFVRGSCLFLWLIRLAQGVHCIGDKANQVILDIYEKIIQEGTNVSEWRPRIEHAQIFAPADLGRIGKLGGQ